MISVIHRRRNTMHP